MKQGRYCALVLGCALLLTGCESWRRLPSPDAPKEVTAASIWQQEEEQPDGQQEQDTGGLAVEQSTATDMLSASITARGEEEPAWSSSDEMLSNKLYSLLTHKNEKFMENFDDREYDYLAQLTDAQGRSTSSTSGSTLSGRTRSSWRTSRAASGIFRWRTATSCAP